MLGFLTQSVGVFDAHTRQNQARSVVRLEFDDVQVFRIQRHFACSETSIALYARNYCQSVGVRAFECRGLGFRLRRVLWF